MSAPVPSAPPTLQSLQAAGQVALFLDFDGTLVDIAPTPDAIELAPQLGERLAALAERLGGALALVSGRSVPDLAQHFGPDSAANLPCACAGSHGADIRDAAGQSLAPPPPELAADVLARMRDFAAREDLVFEAKTHGAALHYRQNAGKAARAQAFVETLADELGWNVQNGKAVSELVAARANKGDAVRAFMQERPFAGTRPVFIGDDLTDEHGFLACVELGGCGILVGQREPSAAQFRLPDVASVHRRLDL